MDIYQRFFKKSHLNKIYFIQKNNKYFFVEKVNNVLKKLKIKSCYRL